MKTISTVVFIGCITVPLAIISALASAQTPMAQSMPSSAPSAGAAEVVAYDAHAIIASAGLSAHAISEQFPSGYIDWTNGKAIAVGEGKATGTSGQQIEMAQRAARLAAARNAILLMGNIRVGPSGRFIDIVNANIQVDAVLEDFEEISSAFDPKTHTATVSLAVSLYGAHGVIHLLRTPSASPTTAVVAQGQSQALIQLAGSVIVIDARGTDVKPCMLPRIVGDKSAGVIFAASRADLDNHPAAIYVTIPAAKAAKADDASQAPLPEQSSTVLVLKAGQVDEKTPGAIVLDAQESARLQNCPNWRQLLASGRLVVITGVSR